MLDATDGRSLRSGFLARAAARPDAPALVIGATTVAYGELERRARVIAAAAVARGPVERVGVFASRSEVAYAATLGALFAGAAFVPLNQKFPVDRTRTMVRRGALGALVVDRGSAAQLPAVLAGLDRVPLVIAPEAEAAAALRANGVAVVGPEELGALAPLAALPPVLGDDLAYLLFTSGTTGEPKGVGVTHANVLHYVDAIQARYGLGPDDRCSQTFDQTFDLAVHDLFVTWGAGAALHVMQPIELLAPVRFVQKHALTAWFSVPSAAALAVKKGMLRPGAMPSLRWSLFCGEPLPDATARIWQESAPNSAVENLYGPTELTIACFAYRWEPPAASAAPGGGIVPIGRPLPGLAALVVDEALAPVPQGEPGELLVCGPQTAPGYWQDGAKTAERFVELPVSEAGGKRFYRTGDRVARGPSGDYVYIGRADNQIKVLGFRVELGEIEAVLLQQPGVSQAVAVGWPLEDGRALGIVAFVSGAAVEPAALLDATARAVPNYMVPSRVLPVDDMPLNANGKIDRRALAATLERAEPA